MTSASSATRTELRGIAAAPGQVVAPAWRWDQAGARSSDDGLSGESGIERLNGAIEAVKSALAAKVERLQHGGATAEAGILEAQALMLDDPALLDGAMALIREGKPADHAVAATMAPYADMLRSSDDPVFQARAADVEDVVEQIRRSLHGISDTPAPPERPSIVVARDLAPSQTAGLDRRLVLGFATEQGSATAHTAILARALGLPAVVGITGLLDRVADAEPLLLDGDGGRLVIDPPADELAAVRAPLGLQTDSAPAVSRSGRRIEVGCNVASLDDAMRAAAAGADGIGLLRSEFVFLQGSEVPTEDEQVAILEPMVAAMGERPVILRTLDVGADKPLPSLPQPAEMNPALGVRGLRLALLRRPDLLTTQIRAALRIAAHHPLRLMVPMVSTVDEVRAVKQMLIEAGEQLGLDPAIMPLGIMVEVPSAAVTAERLASEVEFFSLGTNDLTQYLFAADRTNPELAALADSLHPALLRVIDQVVQAAHRQRRWVGVCGEMASDVEAVPLLVGMGIDELSVHPPQVARVKARVRELRIDACRRLVDAAMELDRPAQVRELIRQSAA